MKRRVMCAMTIALTIAFLSWASLANAECGGYVTIGNKTKLKELQAAGYLPVMKSHGQNGEMDTAENSAEPMESQAKPDAHRPCSGPYCDSGKPSFPVQPPVSSTTSTSTKSCVPVAKDFEVFRPSAFTGFYSFDEWGTLYSLAVDRPPE